MELKESILDAIDEQLSLEDSSDEDVDMMDVEEGEVLDNHFTGQINGGNDGERNHENTQIGGGNDVNMDKKKRNNRKRKKNKKGKNKKLNAAANGGPAPFDLDRFVIGVCKRLREKKSYLVYTAVGVLGSSALGDLVKEVDAIQACGGQKTAEGNRYRTGGGILWNILKTRDPNAYREIMKKGREFEKQFRRPWAVPPMQNNVAPQGVADAITNKTTPSNSDADVELTTAEVNSAQCSTGEKRRSVHERIRVPVSYDDLPGEGPPKEPCP